MYSSYKQILVHADASVHSARRLKLARDIGSRHGALVAALYAATPAMFQVPVGSDASGLAIEALLKADDDKRERARAVFDDVVKAAGTHTTWSEVSDIPVMGGFAQQALYADLCVFGQYEPGGAEPGGVPADFVESILAMSGKPALVLPYIWEESPLGETVVIAWKETREAARAVAAAIPMLCRAREVHVVTWGGDSTSGVTGCRLGLAGFLGQHGIHAIWHDNGPEPGDIGEMLLSSACSLGGDLLVMGCYGHSRAREWILGGASRTLLSTMTLPVLMSH